MDLTLTCSAMVTSSQAAEGGQVGRVYAAEKTPNPSIWDIRSWRRQWASCNLVPFRWTSLDRTESGSMRAQFELVTRFFLQDFFY